MPKTINEKSVQIHNEIWERKAEEGDGSVEVLEPEVKSVVKDVAGRSDATVRRYMEALQEMDIIRHVRADRYVVEEPEGATVEHTGRKRSKHISLPETIFEEAEQFGVNVSAVCADALLDALRSREEYISDTLRNRLNRSEAKYVMELVKNDLHRVVADDQAQHRRTLMREKMYQDVFGVDELSGDDLDAVENLREEAYMLAEELGVA